MFDWCLRKYNIHDIQTLVSDRMEWYQVNTTTMKVPNGLPNTQFIKTFSHLEKPYQCKLINIWLSPSHNSSKTNSKCWKSTWIWSSILCICSIQCMESTWIHRNMANRIYSYTFICKWHRFQLTVFEFVLDAVQNMFKRFLYTIHSWYEHVSGDDDTLNFEKRARKKNAK